MIHLKNISLFLWTKKYILSFVFLFLVILTQRFTNQNQNGLVDSVASDGNGYYAYLPATIIYQDLNYSFYTNPENKIKPCYQPYLINYKEKHLFNKYYCGTAFCMMPFFLISVVISAIAGTNINGYTDTFLMFISLATIFYFLLGTYLITKTARFFNVSQKLAFLVSFLFLFSTNLFHYVVQEPSMSHVYSFFAVSLFFYLLTRVIISTTNKNIILLSLSLGLVALIRPPNVIIILFIPFFFSTIKECGLFFKHLFKNHLMGLLYAVIVFILAVFVQLLFNYIQTQEFFVESYPGETFNFLKPEVYNILFSYKKGLFLYTPIIFALLLFVLLGKSYWYKRIVFLITFLIFLYITSSWWCWNYGGGFSGRPFIDVYPLFIIITFFLFERLSVNTKRVLMIACIPFVFLNQLMAYQYSSFIMDSENMDKQKYWDIFLSTNLLSIQQNKIAALYKHKTVVFTDSTGFEDDRFTQNIAEEGFKSKKSCIVGNQNYYTPALEFNAKQIGVEPTESFYILTECVVKTRCNNRCLSLIISISDGSNCTRWDIVSNSQFKNDTSGWRKMIQVVKINANEMTDKNVIKVFAMANQDYNLVDNVKIRIIK